MSSKSETETRYVMLQRTVKRGGCAEAKDIWKKFCKYVEWIDNHPVLETKNVHFQGQALPYKERKFRPFLKTEALRFIGVSASTWHRWKEKREDLLDVIEDIENIIREQKLIGGYSNQFNTTITAQDLELSTKLDVETRDVGLEEFLRNRVDDDEHQSAYEERRNRRKSFKKMGD